MNRHMQERPSRFRKGYTIYLIVLGALFLAALVVLWIFLARFQHNKDQQNEQSALEAALLQEQKEQEEAARRAPQLAFESWLAGTGADYWTEAWFAQNPDSLDSRDAVREEMERLFDPNAVTCWKSADFTAEAPVYVLKNGEDSLAKVFLTGSGTDWSVSGTEFAFTGDKTASVQAVDGSRVFCNGVELSEEYAGEAQVNFSYEPLADQLLNPVAWRTYTVEGLLLEPELTAEAPEGCSITQTEDGFFLCLDDETALPYRDKALNFIRAYLYYYMMGYNGTAGNMYAVLAYLTPGSQAYQDISDSYNGVIWNTAYSNIDTSDTTAGGAVVWADNCYSVDVSYNATCTLNGQAVEYGSATVRVYFFDSGNGFGITNFEIM